VPRVDADGNETAGIRSPLLAAPLGTYTGWNPIAIGYRTGRYCFSAGGYIPFARTKAERIAKGDRARHWKNDIPAMPTMWPA